MGNQTSNLVSSAKHHHQKREKKPFKTGKEDYLSILDRIFGSDNWQFIDEIKYQDVANKYFSNSVYQLGGSERTKVTKIDHEVGDNAFVFTVDDKKYYLILTYISDNKDGEQVIISQNYVLDKNSYQKLINNGLKSSDLSDFVYLGDSYGRIVRAGNNIYYVEAVKDGIFERVNVINLTKDQYYVYIFIGKQLISKQKFERIN